MSTGTCLILVAATVCVLGALIPAPAGEWPVPVKGFVPPTPGEHPRLFFRKTDLPEIKRRAETPEGKFIVTRLRRLLDGAEGTTVPGLNKPLSVAPDKKSNKDDDVETGDELPIGKSYTLWHGAGYGMLYQLTGDRKYADLGKACTAKALVFRVTDVDPRYSFSKATGALRNGPALGAVAMAYDLCYDGWDETFRETVRKAVEFYDPSKELGPARPANCTLEELARGSRHGPLSNHWGPQIGGAALALLAIQNDPGVDQARVLDLLATNRLTIIRQFSEGQGDHGYYHQHPGAGQITTDTALVPALQAWRVAGGFDFTPDRSEVQWLTVRWAMWLVPTPRGPEYPNPVRKNSYGGEFFSRAGLSRGGQFAQGFGLVPKEAVPALLWTYDNFIRPTEPEVNPLSGLKSGEASFDTVSVYPHRAILSLVNWPIGIEPRNPGTYLPRQVSDQRLQFHFFRNRWKDADDIVVSALLGAEDGGFFSETGRRLRVWGLGRRFNASFPLPGAPGQIVSHGADSWSLAWSNVSLTVDFHATEDVDAVILTSALTVIPDMPQCIPGLPPSGMDLVGRWRSSYGTSFECVKTDSASNLFDTVRREGTINGNNITVTIGDSKREGILSAGGDTISWKTGQRWNRAIKLPPTGSLDLPEGEGNATLENKMLDGEWETDPPDRPVVRLVQRGREVVFPQVPIGAMAMAKGPSVSCKFSLPSGRTSVLSGTVSSCGNIIDWGGQDDWRRVGSPALESGPYGGSDDSRVNLTSVDIAGTRVTAITFSSAGRNPTVSVDGARLRIGSRAYRVADHHLVPE